MVLTRINQSSWGFRILDSPPLPAEHLSPPSLLLTGRITINPEVRLVDFDMGAAMPTFNRFAYNSTKECKY